jgi:hypothetical protein
MPEHSTDGLRAAVKEVVSDGDQWHVHTVNVDGDVPEDILFSQFAPSLPANTIRNAATLIQQEAFAGLIVWLDGVTQRTWPRWKEFLRDYEHVCRSVPMLHRTMFCVPIVGPAALDSLGSEVCLAELRYSGMIDGWDMLLYSAHLLREARLRPLEKRLAVSVAASLALWDPIVCERLAEVGIAELMSPEPVLRDIAKERGWLPRKKAALRDGST